MKIKFSVLILSIIYCSYLLILLAASYYKSSVLNPLNSEYYYQNGFTNKAIEMEPSNAKYHLYYGLELLSNLPKDSFSTKFQLRLAEKELDCAAKLKPYDKLYKDAYDVYTLWIKEQLYEN